MSALAQSGDGRAGLYRSLAVRNRIVGVLRIGVPGIGLVVFLALAGQIALNSLTRPYGIGAITLDRSRVTVETPQYAGVMSDGTAYRVTAGAAAAAVDTLDVITLRDATLVMDNPDGTQTTAIAAEASLQTTDEHITVDDVMHIEMSTGTVGTLVDSFIDMPAQRLIASGPVHLEFGDGSVLDAEGMDYTSADTVYVFTDVVLDQPYMPAGAE